MNLGLEVRIPPDCHYAGGSEAVWRGGVEVAWNQRDKVESFGYRPYPYHPAVPSSPMDLYSTDALSIALCRWAAAVDPTEFSLARLSLGLLKNHGSCAYHFDRVGVDGGFTRIALDFDLDEDIRPLHREYCRSGSGRELNRRPTR